MCVAGIQNESDVNSLGEIHVSVDVYGLLEFGSALLFDLQKRNVFFGGSIKCLFSCHENETNLSLCWVFAIRFKPIREYTRFTVRSFVKGIRLY